MHWIPSFHGDNPIRRLSPALWMSDMRRGSFNARLKSLGDATLSSCKTQVAECSWIMWDKKNKKCSSTTPSAIRNANEKPKREVLGETCTAARYPPIARLVSCPTWTWNLDGGALCPHLEKRKRKREKKIHPIHALFVPIFFLPLCTAHIRLFSFSDGIN